MAKRARQPARPNAPAEAAAQALAEGRFEDAEALATQALAIDPRLAPALATRASARVRRRDYEGAETDIDAAMRAQPAHPPPWLVTLSLIRRGQGRMEEAVRILQDAHALHPASQIVISNLAELLATMRRHAEAHDLLANAICRGADRPGILAQFGRVCRRLDRPADALAPLQAAAARTDHPPAGRQQVLFELGHVLDALGRHADAFAAFAGANALERRVFDIDRHARLVDEVCHTWTRERLRALPRAEGRGRGVILIVGMRRSGTSLVEQILGAHPEVAPGGELPWLRDLATPLDPEAAPPFGLVVDQSRINPQEIERIGRAYTDLADASRDARPFLSDKMPANHKLLGVAQLALPLARVVWCRRDPLDTCLSCYMQPFNDNSYCADLRALARYYHDCRRLMSHWKAELDLPIHEVVYEDLVADAPAHTRALLDFLGLPFHEACLRSHESERAVRTASTDQVTRAVYATSAGRAKLYEAQLRPLAAELRRLGELGGHDEE